MRHLNFTTQAHILEKFWAVILSIGYNNLCEWRSQREAQIWIRSTRKYNILLRKGAFCLFWCLSQESYSSQHQKDEIVLQIEIQHTSHITWKDIEVWQPRSMWKQKFFSVNINLILSTGICQLENIKIKQEDMERKPLELSSLKKFEVAIIMWWDSLFIDSLKKSWSWHQRTTRNHHRESTSQDCTMSHSLWVIFHDSDFIDRETDLASLYMTDKLSFRIRKWVGLTYLVVKNSPHLISKK